MWASAIAAGIKVYDDDDDDRQLRPWLVAFGPLANAWVAYGRSEPTDGLKRIRGVDMSQEPQEKAVYGAVLQTTSYEESPDFLDLDADQKAQLEADVGTSEQGARFWLIAKYD